MPVGLDRVPPKLPTKQIFLQEYFIGGNGSIEPPRTGPARNSILQTGNSPHALSLFETILFALVKQICFGRPQIDNFRTPISILFLLDTFTTIIGIGNARIATNDTTAFKGSIVAFITNMDQLLGIDKGITNHAFAIACFCFAEEKSKALSEKLVTTASQSQRQRASIHNPYY